MGAPVSPIVANLYMEYLEQKGSKHCPHTPSSGTGMWTTPFVIHKETNKASFYTLTVVDPAIRFHSRGHQGGWFHPLLGYYCQTRDGWYSFHNYVQETQTY